MKKIFDFIVKLFSENWAIKIIISFVLFAGFLGLARYYDSDILTIISLFPLGYICLFVLLGILYAYIINPINTYLTEYHVNKVNKGSHYKRFFGKVRIPIIYGKNYSMNRVFRFHEKSVFEFSNTNKYDWSKLYGFSFRHHHKESYRFGFRFIDGQLQICPYVYQNGVRLMETKDMIVNCNLNTNIKLSIVKKDKNVIMKIQDKEYVYEIKNPKLFGYKLGLYIGGNETCPNYIEILKKHK